MTAAQDATPAPVSLVTADGYCLNGNRLRVTSGSGTYGADGSTYQTEIADFSNITAHGAAGNGPAYFTVQGRDGNTYQYGFTDVNGNGANSQVLASGTSTALMWLLSKVIDRAGNNYVINYTALTGTAVPNYILWTPTSAGASTYTYKMLFNYGTNVPQSSFFEYVAGTPVSNTQLLTSIEIFSGATVIKDYFLGYQLSPLSARKELNSITECADSGSNCLLPTAVNYQTGSPGVSTTPTTAMNASAVATRYDFNGDGIPDLITNDGSTWFVAFGSVSGYGTPFNTGIAVGPGPALFGNVTGGHEDGILKVVGSAWTYYVWNGSSFTGTTITGFTYDASSKNYVLADINGDGLPDLFSQKDTTTIVLGHSILTSVVSYHLNTSSSTASFNSTLATAYSTGGGGILSVFLQGPDAQFGKIRRYDFNGDGRDDLIVQVESGTAPNLTLKTYELISNGTAFSVSAPISTIPASTTFIPIFFTNWNDDKCTDFVTSNTLYISGCNGAAPQIYSLPGTILAGLDWDGDGRTDILVYSGSGSFIGVYLSPGTSTVAPSITSTLVPWSASCNYVWMDANGDGLDDLGCQSTTSPFALSYFQHNGTSDLATSFADGYGVTYSPSYVPLSSSGGIYAVGTSAVFPNQDYSGPMYVVSSYSGSDGIGGTYTCTYSYVGAVMNLQGRGFQGFNKIKFQDSRTGFYDYQYFQTSFPSAGMLQYHIVTPQNGAHNLRYTTYNETTKTLDSTINNQRYFPYYSSINDKQYELGGALDAQLITTSVRTYGAPDNFGNYPTIETAVTDNDSTSPYFNQQWTSTIANTVTADASANWCLNLPTEVDTTNTAPGVPSIARHVGYLLPDYVNCRETEQVVEAGTAFQVDTKYAYLDSFGNITGQTVTGSGMAARTTSINWGTTGQFPATLTNALNQTTNFSFDPNTGMIASVTDPNGTQTSWLYDTFQRESQETRPDQTYTIWAYNNCSTAGCVNSNNRMTVLQTNHNKDGSTVNSANQYLDAFDRSLVTSKQLVSGAYDRIEVQYDNLGNVHKTAAPCLFASCVQYWTSFAYDALSRLIETERPVNSSSGQTYCNPSTVPPVSGCEGTAYSYQGRTTIATDAQGKKVTTINFVTGAAGRTTDHNSYSVNFNRDAFGSVLSVTDSLSNTLRSTTAYDYGIGAFPRNLNDMDLGTRVYTHDALGEVTAYSDGLGNNFSETFDALSRMTSRTEPGLTTIFTFGSSASSNNIGKLASVSSTESVGTLTHAFSFDSVGRITSDTTTLPTGQVNTFNYSFDSNSGLLSQLKYPNSYPSTFRLAVDYSYQYGILHHLYDDASPATVWYRVDSVNPAGQATQESSQYAATDPEIIQVRSFDAVTGWLNSIQGGAGGGAALQNQSYTYDFVGNVIQRQDNNRGLTENFYYDNVYRLDHSTLGGATNLQMGYDAMGNITSRSDIAGGAAWTYDPVHKHRVTQAGSSSYTYTYDSNGNVRNRNGQGIGWTSYNYPTAVSTSTEYADFNYGPDRQRWRMIYSGPSGIETTFYTGSLFEQVGSSTGNDFRHYIFANGRAVAVVSHTNSGAISAHSLLVDHQGSVASIVTQSTGANLVSESFTAYGSPREASTWSGAPTSGELTTMNGVTREGYTFQTVLGSMGLNHTNGRIEDSITGRFLSPDPHGIIRGNTQSWNRYSYVNNNPMSFVDPTGFTVCFQPKLTLAGGCGNFGGGDAGLLAGAIFGGGADDGFGNLGGSSADGGSTNSTDAASSAFTNALADVLSKVNANNITLDTQSGLVDPGSSLPQSEQAAFGSNADFSAASIYEIEVDGVRSTSGGDLVLTSGQITTPLRFGFTDARYTHIAIRHVGFKFPFVSQFYPQYGSKPALKLLIDLILAAGPGVLQPNGNYNWTYDLGFPIGLDANSLVGSETSWLTLIVNPKAPGGPGVWTMYPSGP